MRSDGVRHPSELCGRLPVHRRLTPRYAHPVSALGVVELGFAVFEFAAAAFEHRNDLLQRRLVDVDAVARL